ncbi:MAG: hypothetical protein KKD33_03770, partial [Verrucomicrobia bacterium]|nr:hypothetical protein [Verrucomicrobiota bacterium]
KLTGRGLYHLTVEAQCGEARAKAETWVAVVFTPSPPSENSPWGIFYTPHIWFDKGNPEGPRWAAIQHRLLGASWTRLNFWAHSFEKVTIARREKPSVSAEYPTWRQYARELRKEGIFIFGEIAQCPRELSSRPDDRQEAGDAGPVFNRVKPSDYCLWDSLMEKLAADFRDEIHVWEIWNEANLQDRYWTGTVEDFAELVEHTSGAIRRGNPEARIAAAGFVNGHAFADRLLTLGMGKHIDILSVHYTDENPGAIDDWKKLLEKHKLPLPIWNSEEKSEVPIRNIAGGIERSFKFIHVSIGYPEYRPLVRKDWTVLPSGILFSVGAHCIGSGKSVGHSDKVKGYDVQFFRRDKEIIGVFDPAQRTGDVRLFGPVAAKATLTAERLTPPGPGVKPIDSRPRVTDVWGRSRPLAIENGRAIVPLSGSMLFVNGCRKLDVLSAEIDAAASGARAFEAESGRFSKGFGVSNKKNFSGGRILEIWAKDDPGPDGYWAELKFIVPRAGRYEILFSGNSLARLKPPRSLSPFKWRIDDGEEREAKGVLPVISGIAGAPEGLSVLGTEALSQGEHTFRLTLSGRRDEPDKYYALWFDVIGLRPAGEELK